MIRMDMAYGTGYDIAKLAEANGTRYGWAIYGAILSARATLRIHFEESPALDAMTISIYLPADAVPLFNQLAEARG